MSLRQVLTIYNTERQLSDDETALLNTLRRLTDAERALFVEQLSDKPQKKSSKKAAGGGGKSKRGESLKGQLDNRRQERSAMVYCIRDINGLECGEPEASTIHSDSTYVNYHEFVAPPVSSAAGSGG